MEVEGEKERTGDEGVEEGMREGKRRRGNTPPSAAREVLGEER